MSMTPKEKAIELLDKKYKCPENDGTVDYCYCETAGLCFGDKRVQDIAKAIKEARNCCQHSFGCKQRNNKE